MLPLKYWFSGVALYQFVSFAFVTLVALLGIKDLLSQRYFFVLVSAALVLGGLAWWTAAKQAGEGAESTENLYKIAAAVGINAGQPAGSLVDQVTEAITGGRNFSYFKLKIDDPAVIDGPFQLWLDATGSVYDVNYWISPASANRNPNLPAYRSLDVRKPYLPIVYKGPHAWDRAVPLGDFIIEFDARNGHWVESLKVFVSDGGLKQRIVVTGQDGAPLLQTDGTN